MFKENGEEEATREELSPLMGNKMTYDSEKEKSIHFDIENSPFVLNILQLTSILTLWIFGYLWLGHELGGFTLSSSDSRLFNLHPLLMLIGPIGFSSLSITLFKRNKTGDRIKTKKLHVFFHLFSMLCLIVGLYAVIEFHKVKGFPHFTSLHSWIGLFSAALFSILYVTSFLVFFYPGAKLATRMKLIQIHKKLGLVLVTILFPVTSFSGILEKLTFMKSCTGDTFSNSCLYGNFSGLLVVVISMLTILIIFRKM